MPVPDRVVVADALLAELPALAARSVDTISGAVPAYRAVRGPQLVDVRNLAGWAVSSALLRWSRAADGPVVLRPEEQVRVRAIGTARAADGRPVAEILRAYRLGSALLLREVATRGGDRLDRADIVALGEVVLGLLGEFSDLIVESYAGRRAEHASDRERACSELLDDLLIGRQTSAGALRDRARQLRFDLPGWPVTVVVRSADPAGVVTRADLAAGIAALDGSASSRDAAGTSDPSAVTPPDGRLSTTRANRGVLLVPDTVTPDRIDALCIDRGWQACAVAGVPVHQTADSYRLATEALDTAPPHAFATRAVLDRGDAAVLSLLGARPVVDPGTAVEAVLGPLLPDSQAHLLEGVTAFVAAGSAAAAAGVLRLHVQTVRYRLRRVHELTRRDPHDPWQRTVFAVALQLHRATRTPSS